MSTLSSSVGSSNAQVASLGAGSLRPKEHGAYAILAIPLVTALIVAEPSWVGVATAMAAIAAFGAHEPLLIAIGHRGGRLQRAASSARKRLVALLAMTVGCGTLAMFAGSTALRWSLAGCILLGSASFLVAIVGRHRTLGGQLLGVMGLSVPCVPVLLAGDSSVSFALEAWAIWVIGFAATTLAVRSVIASQKRRSTVLHFASIAALTICVALMMATGFCLPIVTLPMLLASWYLLLFPPPARSLKPIGWTLVAMTVASAMWMVMESCIAA